MAKTINVAVLTHAGAAHVTAYLQALAATDACAEVALADPDGKWEKDAKSILGKKLTDVDRDHAKILDRHRPGMALVTMEAKLAPPVIDIALDHDCHVYAEKPACVDPKDFAPLVKKADSHHRHLMLALANRLNPELLAAKKLIANGVIGNIYALEMNLVADQTRLKNPAYHKTWFAQKDRAGGGHLLWLGIHWLDLAMHVTQSPIVDVAGFTANVGGQPIDVEDAAAAALRFANGALGTMTSGYFLDKRYHSRIKIWGSDGWLHLEQMKDQPLHWYAHNGPDAGKIIPWTGDKQPRGYTPYVRRAVEACAGLAEPPISNADSLRALKTVFAVYQAAQTNRTVNIQ